MFNLFSQQEQREFQTLHTLIISVPYVIVTIYLVIAVDIESNTTLIQQWATAP